MRNVLFRTYGRAPVLAPGLIGAMSDTLSPGFRYMPGASVPAQVREDSRALAQAVERMPRGTLRERLRAYRAAHARALARESGGT